MINKVIILYKKEDLVKNKKFIQILTECFEKKGIKPKVLIDGEDSFEHITKGYLVINRSRNFELALRLEKQGAKLVNSSEVTRIGNDKWETYLWARRQGIPVLDTYKGDMGKLKYPIVVKSLAGHGGDEVFLAENEEEKNEYIRIIESRWGKDNFIIQPFAATEGKDIRVYLLNGKFVVAMCRKTNGKFKSNYSLGGSSEQIELTDSLKTLVNKIARENKFDYVGIDFIYDGENIVLNEIEDAVGARMVYENTDIDIVKMFGDWMANSLNIW